MLAVANPNPSFSRPDEQTFKSSRLNSKALPNGVITVYLHNTFVTGTVTKTAESARYAFISFLHNLNTPSTELPGLIKSRNICTLHVQDGIIRSLTLTTDKLQLITDNEISEVAVLDGDNILLIKEDFLVRPFDSDAQYVRYTNGLV